MWQPQPDFEYSSDDVTASFRGRQLCFAWTSSKLEIRSALLLAFAAAAAAQAVRQHSRNEMKKDN
jgi:hypothetical protein